MMSCEYLRVIYYFLKYLFHVFMFLSIAFFKSLVVLDFFFFFFFDVGSSKIVPNFRISSDLSYYFD